jgi:cytochrome P450
VNEVVSFQAAWARTHQFDPPEIFDRLRAKCPLARMSYPDGHIGWLATGHETVRKVLSDPRFSHSLEICHFPVTKYGAPLPQFPTMPGMFIHMDAPDHTRYRRMLSADFTARRASRLAPHAEAVALELAVGMRDHGAPADLVATYIKPFVLRLVCEVIGLPYAERARFERTPDITHDPDGDPELAAAAFQETVAFVNEVIEHKRAQPGDDILSRLVAHEDLTTEELCNITLLVLTAGYVTTESALAVGVFALLEHEDQLAALRADMSKLDASVEEILRYLTVNQYENFRTAVEDVELDGEVVRKGETVTVSLPAANRDPAKFSCPGELDLSRETTGHLAFGYGSHQCLGQNLGRVMLRAGFAALLKEFPGLRLAVPLDEVPLKLQTSVFGVGSLPVSW